MLGSDLAGGTIGLLLYPARQVIALKVVNLIPLNSL